MESNKQGKPNHQLGIAGVLIVLVIAVAIPFVVIGLRSQQSLTSDARGFPGCRWFFCRTPRPSFLPTPIASFQPSPLPSGCYYKPGICSGRFLDGSPGPDCRPMLVCPQPTASVAGSPLPSDFCRLTGRPLPCPTGPVASCLPRPKCLDSVPRCLMPEPAEGWCPSSTSSLRQQ